MLKKIICIIFVCLFVQLITAGIFTICSWNVRGYPEIIEDYRQWFIQKLRAFAPIFIYNQGILSIEPDVIVCSFISISEEEIKELVNDISVKVLVPPGPFGNNKMFGENGNRYDHFLFSNDLFNEEALEAQSIVFDESDLEKAMKVLDHFPIIAPYKHDLYFNDASEIPNQ